jgi:hypothetical protein
LTLIIKIKNMQKSRREFVRKVAMGTAGITMGGLGLSAKSYGNIIGANSRVNVGIVGFSNRTRGSLIGALSSQSRELNFSITAVSDIWSRRRDEAKAFLGERNINVDLYRNNEELYEKSNVDAVIIGTADFQHALHTIEAVEAGKDVYVEKPFAETMEDNRKAREAVERSGKNSNHRISKKERPKLSCRKRIYKVRSIW